MLRKFPNNMLYWFLKKYILYFLFSTLLWFNWWNKVCLVACTALQTQALFRLTM